METGLGWLLLHWKLEVFSRPGWNTKIIVKTWPRNFNRCYSCRDFEVYDESEKLLAVASSKWVLFNFFTNSISKVTEERASKYKLIDKCVFDNPDFDKIKEPENSVCTFEYTVQRRDLDMNQHVNNTNYIDFAYEALPADVYESADFKNVEVMYKHELRLGDVINCFYARLDGGECVVVIKNKENGMLNAIVKLF